MKIDKKLKELPLSKMKPNSLAALFGEKDIQAMWMADSEFEFTSQ